MKIEEFLSYWGTQKGCSPCTLRAYRSDLLLYRQFLGEMGMRDMDATPVTISMFEKWLEARPNPRFRRQGLKYASIKRRVAAVRSYYAYLRAVCGCTMRDPAVVLTRSRTTNKKPKPIPDDILAQLLSGITDARDSALYTLLLASGLRVDEVHQLNRDGISVITEPDSLGAERVLGTGVVIGKGGKQRTFFFDEDALKLLAEYLQTRNDSHPALFISERRRRLSIRAIQRNLQAWCKKLGLPHLNVHRLRHSYATQLANANIDTMVLKDLMGHADPSTTKNYYDLNRTTLAREYFAAKERRF